MFHEPRLAIVGLSRDRQVRHAVALGMLQQIFELLQDLVGLRVRYPTVLLDMGDALFNRLVQQFACFGGEVLAIHIIRVPRYPRGTATNHVIGDGWWSWWI